MMNSNSNPARRETMLRPFPAGRTFPIVNDMHMALCDGDYWAAALLSNLIYWHETVLSTVERDFRADTPIFQRKDYDELKYDLLGQISRTVLGAAVRVVVSKGYVTQTRNPANHWDSTCYFLVNTEAIVQAAEKVKDQVKPRRRPTKPSAPPTNPSPKKIETSENPVTGNPALVLPENGITGDRFSVSDYKEVKNHSENQNLESPPSPQKAKTAAADQREEAGSNTFDTLKTSSSSESPITEDQHLQLGDHPKDTTPTPSPLSPPPPSPGDLTSEESMLDPLVDAERFMRVWKNWKGTPKLAKSKHDAERITEKWPDGITELILHAELAKFVDEMHAQNKQPPVHMFVGRLKASVERGEYDNETLDASVQTNATAHSAATSESLGEKHSAVAPPVSRKRSERYSAVEIEIARKWDAEFPTDHTDVCPIPEDMAARFEEIFAKVKYLRTVAPLEKNFLSLQFLIRQTKYFKVLNWTRLLEKHYDLGTKAAEPSKGTDYDAMQSRILAKEAEKKGNPQ